MVLISAVPAGAGYKAKQKPRSNTPARHFQPSSSRGLPEIFQSLVIPRMNRAGLEIEQLMRKRALKT